MKTLKLKNTPDSRVHWISDCHAFHGNIIKYCNRPFLCPEDTKYFDSIGRNWDNEDPKHRHKMSWKSVDMMNQTMVVNINATVKKDDWLIHCGDWAFGGKHNYYDNCKWFRNQINCKNVVNIWGNHDEDVDEKDANYIADLFTRTADILNIVVDGTSFIACHYMFAIWPKNHRGAFNYYGHSHTTAESWADKTFSSRRSIDVGIDNAKRLLGEYRPFSHTELMDILADRKGYAIDHHREHKNVEG